MHKGAFRPSQVQSLLIKRNSEFEFRRYSIEWKPMRQLARMKEDFGLRVNKGVCNLVGLHSGAERNRDSAEFQ